MNPSWNPVRVVPVLVVICQQQHKYFPQHIYYVSALDWLLIYTTTTTSLNGYIIWSKHAFYMTHTMCSGIISAMIFGFGVSCSVNSDSERLDMHLKYIGRNIVFHRRFVICISGFTLPVTVSQDLFILSFVDVGLQGRCTCRLCWSADDWTSYCEISDIRRTKFQNLNISRLVLQLSLPNPLGPGVKSRMKI